LCSAGSSPLSVRPPERTVASTFAPSAVFRAITTAMASAARGGPEDGHGSRGAASRSTGRGRTSCALAHATSRWRRRRRWWRRRGTVVAKGVTNVPGTGSGGIKVFAGLRSDPFFFDLDAFRQVVKGENRGRKGFCDQANGQGVDFFASLNTNAVIIEVPDSAL